MFNFFDIIKAVYKKEKTIIAADTSLNLTLCKWLSYDVNNISILSKLIKYIFCIEPLHFYYLLFCNIPKKSIVPFLKKQEEIKKEETNNLFFSKMKYIFDWTDREFEYNRDIIKKLDNKINREKLGVGNEKTKN